MRLDHTGRLFSQALLLRLHLIKEVRVDIGWLSRACWMPRHCRVSVDHRWNTLREVCYGDRLRSSQIIGTTQRLTLHLIMTSLRVLRGHAQQGLELTRAHGCMRQSSKGLGSRPISLLRDHTLSCKVWAWCRNVSLNWPRHRICLRSWLGI